MNVNAFLRWAAVNMLLGSWDNYYASGSNYYLYNSGRRGAAKDFVSSPYFHFIPWDYDNCLGIDYSGTKWQYADILDWPGKTNRHKPKIPLVRNLLRNHDYRQYYLDYLEHMLDTEFNPKAIAAQIAPRSEDGLWYRVRHAAYLESDTRDGARPPVGGTATTRFTGAAADSTNCGTGKRRWKASSTTSACVMTAPAFS